MKTRECRESFNHVNQGMRDRIEALLESGHTQKEVAGVLGVHPSTITRELKRNPGRIGRYVATRAQEHAHEQRSHAKFMGMKIDEHPALKARVIADLKAGRSPDEISGRMREKDTGVRIGKDAIYQWIYETVEGKQYARHLCSQRPRKLRQSRLSKRQLIPRRVAEKKRDRTVAAIHGEGDCFVSPISSGDLAVGVLGVQTTSRLLAGKIVPRKTHKEVTPTMQHISRRLKLDTLTLDNGVENVPHEQFGPTTYFCTPGTPSEKPHIENEIGLSRRWFLPKGTRLSTVPNRRFQKMLNFLNHKHRKSLGYRSAYEVALEQGIIGRIPQRSIKNVVAFR